MTTIADIIKPSNASGFKFVRSASAGPNGGGQTELWKAEINRAGEHWRSPYYRKPMYAAAALIDHLNGEAYTPIAVTPATQSGWHRLKTAEHTYASGGKLSDDPEYEAALGAIRDFKAQAAGKQGYVYLIGEADPAGGTNYVKIGYSVNPDKRVAELQTGNPRQLAVLAKFEGTVEDERALHAMFRGNNKLLEWFYTVPEIIEEFKKKAV